MKRRSFFLAAIISIVVAACVGVFSACSDENLKEVAGTYEMTYISGTINGVTVTTSMYEYFTLSLEEDGDAIVRSKGAGVGGTEYEARGTYTYSDGEIRVTTRNGVASVTETYQYADGVITYDVDTAGMDFTITFARQN